MKSPANDRWLFCVCLLVGIGLLIGPGCATPEANPSRPRANRGYADFYADPAMDVFWKVDECDDRGAVSRVIYSEYKSPMNGFLRLELPPGRHHLRLTFLNLTTEGPVPVEVPITSQKITPVRVVRIGAGSTYIRDVDDKLRHPGRRRKVTDVDVRVFKLTPEVQDTASYQPKERMAYAQPEG
jgi:hypothetical protein